MARGINKVTLIGNLGADPEMRYTQGGLAIARLRLATSDSVKDRASGEFRDVTEWHRVVCFDRLAEICGEFLRKGSKVYIEGRLSTSKYDKDGQTHYSTDIIAREMQMLDGRGQGGGSEEGGGFEPRQANSGSRTGGGGMSGGSAGGGHSSGGSAGGGRRREEAPAATAPAEDFDDDIPF